MRRFYSGSSLEILWVRSMKVLDEDFTHIFMTRYKAMQTGDSVDTQMDAGVRLTQSYWSSFETLKSRTVYEIYKCLAF